MRNCTIASLSESLQMIRLKLSVNENVLDPKSDLQ